MIAVKSTRRIALAKLKPYPGNARVHDLPTIKESIRVNGQFQTLVVRQATMHVLAGNGTFQAMRELAADGEFGREALCHLVDVNAAQARRIVLADNRPSDRASYDEGALARLLASAAEHGGLEGTGYESADVDSLLARLEPPSPDPVEIPPSFEILVEVDSEAEQVKMLERLTGEGFRCRALL